MKEKVYFCEILSHSPILPEQDWFLRIDNITLESEAISKVVHFTRGYEITLLQQYFYFIKQISLSANFEVGFLLENAPDVYRVTYNGDTKTWVLYNAKKQPFICVKEIKQELNDDFSDCVEMADQVAKAFFPQLTEKEWINGDQGIIFSTTIYTKKSHKDQLDQIIQDLQSKIGEWNNINELGEYQIVIRDLEGNSLLHFAAKNGQASLVSELLSKEKDPNLENLKQKTPLFLASENGQKSVVELLLQHPIINPNAITKEGATSLFAALLRGHTSVVQLLIQHPKIDIDYTSFQIVKKINEFIGGSNDLNLLFKQFHKFETLLENAGTDKQRSVWKNSLAAKIFHAFQAHQSSDLNKNKIISKQSFEKEVEEFLNTFRISSLNELFEQTHTNRILPILFFSSCVVYKFLTRTPKVYKDRFFDCEEPKISKREQELYDAILSIRRSTRFTIPYRTEKAFNADDIHSFSHRGGGDAAKKIQISLLEKIDDDPKVKIFYPMDIYDIAKQAQDLKLNPTPPSFMLIPNWKDDHASLVLFVVKDDHTVYSVLLNSFINDDYYEFLKDRFGLYKNFEIPFFDASFHIQTEKQDRACTLYSYNILLALSELLKNNHPICEKLLNLNPKNISQSQQLMQELPKILEEYLPMYFIKNQVSEKDNYSLIAHSDVHQYHIQQRWEMGNIKIKKIFENSQKELKKISQSFTSENEKLFVFE